MSRTLYQWEKILKQQILGGDVLLGQLPLGHPPYDQTDMDTLGELLSIQLKLSNFKKSLRYIARKFPLSFALYLVLHGIYSYDSGKFWPKVEEHLGNNIKGFQGASCGETFRRILLRHNLPLFEHIEGLANLVPILAHGGIPNDSLDKFFNVLEKTTTNSLIILDAETLIEDWSENPDEKLYFVGRPVRRFVLYGGPVAEDFLNRCLTLIDSEEPEAAQRLQLPERIVETYWLWRKSVGPKRTTRPKVRLARPFLYLDPYGDGVCIGLPPQFFPTTHKQQDLAWRIEANNFKWEETTYRERVAKGYEYKTQNLVSPTIAPNYEVILSANGKEIRSWQLPGWNAKQPLLIFDPDTGRVLNKLESRRPGDKWLLYPKDYELQITNGRLLRKLPRQYGSWGLFSVEECSLSAGGQLDLCSPAGDIYPLKIINELALRRPHFQGGQKPLGHHVNETFPLYSGSPPKVIISFPYRPDDNQLARWSITIRPEGTATPNEQKSYSLLELDEAIFIQDDNSIQIDLGVTKLLGSRPIGTFEIHAQGPFGRGRRLGLRIVPYFAIEGQEKLYLSHLDGPAILRLFCDSDSSIALRSPEAGISIAESDDGDTEYVFKIESSINLVRLVINGKDGAQVPFTIRLRRLRWGIFEQTNPDRFFWQVSPRRIYPQTLDNPLTTDLRVDLPVFGDYASLYCGWRLVDADDSMKKERPPDLEHSREDFSISLGEFMPEFRNAQRSGEVLRLQLWIHIVGENDSVDEHFVDTLFLLPMLDLGEIIADWKKTDDQIKLAIMWEHQQKVRYRKLHLWPVDQPWIEQPIKLPINEEMIDSAEWCLSISDYQMLQDYQGVYLGEIKIVDPWDNQIPQRPTLDHPNVIEIQPLNADKYYVDLKTTLDIQQAIPEQMLTLLTYQYRSEQHNEMHNTNREVYLKRHELSLSQLVLWARITAEIDDPTTYQLAQLSMFSPETLQLKLDPKTASTLQAQYFAHWPSKPSLISEDAYIYLASSFEQVSKKCVVELCLHSSQFGYLFLLREVDAARILVTEAADLLKPVADDATRFLRKQNSRDANAILHALRHL